MENGIIHGRLDLGLVLDGVHGRVKCDGLVTLFVTLLDPTSTRTFIMSDVDEHEFHAEDDGDMGDAGNAPEEEDAEQDDPAVPEKRRIERDVFDEEEEEEEDGDEEELSGKKSRKRAKVGKIVFA